MPGSSAREHRNRGRLRRRVGVGVLMLGLAVVADSDQSATTARQFVRGRVAGATSVASAAPTWSGALAFTPAPNAADVPVAAPVVVTVAAAILDTVTLTDTEGRQVTGDFDPGRRGWHATAPLDYNRRYTVTVTAIDLAGR
jgi:Bacterial Ig domain